MRYFQAGHRKTTASCSFSLASGCTWHLAAQALTQPHTCGEFNQADSIAYPSLKTFVIKLSLSKQLVTWYASCADEVGKEVDQHDDQTVKASSCPVSSWNSGYCPVLSCIQWVSFGPVCFLKQWVFSRPVGYLEQQVSSCPVGHMTSVHPLVAWVS